ncbi:DUF977 family protein [Candidatus Pacearchaeota archaeon]|nr:DUF977 family protein [Candidatus Pacearchaeota archaeon]
MNITIGIVMNIHSKKIIGLIKKEKVVTSSEVADVLGLSWNTADKYLMELLIEGKIDRIKKAGVNLWALK